MKKVLCNVLIVPAVILLTNTGHAVVDNYIDKIDITVNSDNRYFVTSDIENDANNINISEANFDVAFAINPDNDISWDVAFINKHVFLDANTAVVDLPSMLVGREMRVGTELPIPFVGDADYRIGLASVPSYYTDSWEDSFDDFETGAFRWKSEVWVNYRSQGALDWKVGAIIRPEHTNAVLPLLDITYAFNDEWSVRLESDDFGVTYTPNKQWAFFSEFGYVLDEYETVIGGVQGRVLRHQHNTLGLGARYHMSETNYVQASTGWGFNRSLRYEEASSEGEVDIEDAPYFKFELVFMF